MTVPPSIDQRPVHVLQGSEAVRLRVPASPSPWRTALDRRRAIVALALTPITVLLFLDAPVRSSLDRPVEWAVLGVLGVLSALIAATFVPRADGLRTVAASPCGAMAGIYPVVALMSLGGQPMGAVMSLFSVLLLGYGLSQRVLGTGACSA